MLVVKVGGGEGNVLDPVLDDLAELWQEGRRWILVHGGSARTNEVATALGHPPRFVTSTSGYTSRRTDRETTRIFAMVYAGETNTLAVEGLHARGVNALGLSGLDGRLLEGPRKKVLKILEKGRPMILRDDYTGSVTKVNRQLLDLLIESGYAPVISPPAISSENEIMNVDGDRAAAAIAAALGVEDLVLLTGAPGLLRDAEDETSVIRALSRTDIEDATGRFARGRMRLKLLAAQEALQGGVGRVLIAASASENPVRAALDGAGTAIS